MGKKGGRQGDWITGGEGGCNGMREMKGKGDYGGKTKVESDRQTDTKEGRKGREDESE